MLDECFIISHELGLQFNSQFAVNMVLTVIVLFVIYIWVVRR